MTHGGARGAQQAFELQAGDDVRVFRVGVDVGEHGGVERFAAGADNDRADLKVPDDRPLRVVDGLGEAGIDALPHSQQSPQFTQRPASARPAGSSKPSSTSLKLPRRCSTGSSGICARGRRVSFLGIGPIARVLVARRGAALGQVAAVEVAQNRLGRFLAGGDRADRDRRAGLQIAAGEDARARSVA